MLALAVVIIHSSAYNAHSKSIPIFFLYLLSRLVSISIHFVPFPIHAWSNRTIRQLALFPLYLRQQQQPSRRRLQRKEIVSRSCWLPIIYLVCVCMWVYVSTWIGMFCFQIRIVYNSIVDIEKFQLFPLFPYCLLITASTYKQDVSISDVIFTRRWHSLKITFSDLLWTQIRYSYSFHKGYLYLGVRVLQSIHCTLFGIPFLFHSIFFSLG